MRTAGNCYRFPGLPVKLVRTPGYSGGSQLPVEPHRHETCEEETSGKEGEEPDDTVIPYVNFQATGCSLIMDFFCWRSRKSTC